MITMPYNSSWSSVQHTGHVDFWHPQVQALSGIVMVANHDPMALDSALSMVLDLPSGQHRAREPDGS
jgi:hypothetical protein